MSETRTTLQDSLHKSQTKTASAPLLATKLGISLEEANRAIDILLILGVIKTAKIEKRCTTCPYPAYANP